MNLTDIINQFFTKIFKTDVLNPDKEDSKNIEPHDDFNIKNQPQNTFKEYVSIYDIPNYASYTERVAALISMAEEKDGIYVHNSSDYAYLVFGAVLEEKGASANLMNLYSNSTTYVLEPRFWDSSSNNMMNAFFIPKFSFEHTANGIRKLMNEYRKIVSTNSNGDVCKIQADDKYECFLPVWGGEIPHALSKSTFHLTQYIKIANGQRLLYGLHGKTTIYDYESGTKQMTEHIKTLEKENGEDMIIEEEKKENGKTLYYCVERKGENAIVTIGDSRDPSISNSVSYTQGAPESLLDQDCGLGYYDSNTNAQSLYSGEISVEELEEHVWPNDSKGLELELELESIDWGLGL